jgi:anti-anti-sigma factor
MSDLRTPPVDDQPLPGTVEVGHLAPGLAVVCMRGEHDLSTQPQLMQALAQAASDSDVLVDLSECSFIDSSVIKALVAAQLDVTTRGDRLEVVFPSSGSSIVNRTFQLMRLRDVLSVHESVEEARDALDAQR